MIVLDNSGVNTVYLTLSECVSVSTPEFTFSATSTDTNETVSFDFTILETTDRWDVGEIDGTLFTTGQWEYEVTEKTENVVVERGLISVNDPDTAGGWNTYVEYDNQDDETRGRYNEDD